MGKPLSETLDSVFGAVEALERPEDFQQRRDDAIDDHVESVVRGMRAGESSHGGVADMCPPAP